MDLRRRNKQHVMETMEGKTPAPRAHEFACRHDVLGQYGAGVGFAGRAAERRRP